MTIGGPLGAEHQSKLKAYLNDEAVKALAAEPDKLKDPKDIIHGALTQAYTRTKLQLPDKDRKQIFDEITSGLIGFGPLQPLLDDAEVTEVMVNGPLIVYAERNGRIEKTDVIFIDNEQVIRVIENIIHASNLSRLRSSHKVWGWLGNDPS